MENTINMNSLKPQQESLIERLSDTLKLAADCKSFLIADGQPDDERESSPVENKIDISLTLVNLINEKLEFIRMQLSRL